MPRVFFPTRLGNRIKFNFSVLRIFLFPSMILWEDDGMRNRDGGGRRACVTKIQKDPAWCLCRGHARCVLRRLEEGRWEEQFFGSVVT